MSGDSLVVEYLFFYLIFLVYSWIGIMFVGKFILNVSGCLFLDLFLREMYKFVEYFVFKCYFLFMILNNMNLLNFVFKKDYIVNRFKSSIF